MIRSPLMNVMTSTAMKAGKGLRQDFSQIAALNISKKGPGDFVSQADKRAEATIFRELERARPDYCFVMEESGVVEGTDKTHRWHIDPLDGTTNFLHGIPIFAVSIALEREGQIVAGVVYNPITDDLYVAEKGAGAFHNNHRMRVSVCDDPRDALVGFGLPHIGKSGAALAIREMGAVMGRVGGLRRMGAAALDLASVANGQTDGFWERGLSSWDIAAGIVLVREAGGYVSDLKGGDSFLSTGNIVVGTESVHKELVSVLSKLD